MRSIQKVSLVLAALLVPAVVEAAPPVKPIKLPNRTKPSAPKPTTPDGKPQAARSTSPSWKVTRIGLKSSTATVTYRIAVVAEGYRAEDAKQFADDGQALVSSIRSNVMGQTFCQFANLDIYLLFCPSNEAASVSGPRDTLFKAQVDDDTVTLGRAGKGNTSPKAMRNLVRLSVQQAVGYAIPNGSPAVTIILVRFSDLVAGADMPRANADFPEDGGAVRIPAADVGAVSHELGHALFGLGDEYSDSNKKEKALNATTFSLFVSRCYNITNEPNSDRWKAHAGSKLIEGGACVGKGVWHPYKNCGMGDGCPDGALCTACYYAVYGKTYFEGKGHDPRYHFGWMGLLHTPSIAAGATGMDTLLFHHADPTNAYILGKLDVPANTGFTLHFANFGALPRVVTITLEGPHDSVAFKAVLGDPNDPRSLATALHVFVPGLPPLADDGAAYLVRIVCDDHPELPGYAGAVLVAK